MDSMDWFDPSDKNAEIQVQSLNRALKLGGKVLLRSAALRPWYTSVFERNGFVPKRVGARLPGTCIDRYVTTPQKPSEVLPDILVFSGRVNMYASTWICTKTETTSSDLSNKVMAAFASAISKPNTLEEIDLGSPMVDQVVEAEDGRCDQ